MKKIYERFVELDYLVDYDVEYDHYWFKDMVERLSKEGIKTDFTVTTIRVDDDVHGTPLEIYVEFRNNGYGFSCYIFFNMDTRQYEMYDGLNFLVHRRIAGKPTIYSDDVSSGFGELEYLAVHEVVNDYVFKEMINEYLHKIRVRLLMKGFDYRDALL